MRERLSELNREEEIDRYVKERHYGERLREGD